MLLGRPLRPEISRSGSASPEARNAVSTRDAWTIDLTRYGSRAGVSLGINNLESLVNPEIGCRRHFWQILAQILAIIKDRWFCTVKRVVYQGKVWINRSAGLQRAGEKEDLENASK